MSHPLHRLLYPNANSPFLHPERGMNCGIAARMTGTVETRSIPALGLRVEAAGATLRPAVEGGRAGVLVGSATRLRDRIRLGLPYVAEGDRLAISARRCREKGEPGGPDYLIALRIRRLPR